MAAITLWIEASRPKTLIASIAPVLIGTAMTSFAGFFQFHIFLLTILTGLFIQIGTNFANDYFDFKKGIDSPEKIGPRKLIVENLVSVESMGIATIFAFGSSILSAIPLILERGPIVGWLLFFAILFGILYSAGPYSLSHLGLGDIFVVIFFGCIATGMTFYLQTGTFLWDGFIAGLAPGLLSCSILCIDNLRDQDSDRIANKRSLPVRFGQLFGKMEYLFAMTLPFCIPPLLVYSFNYSPKILVALAAAVPALFLVTQVFRTKSHAEYACLLKKTALTLALYTLLFCLGLFL